jgi:hypothetical protein
MGQAAAPGRSGVERVKCFGPGRTTRRRKTTHTMAAAPRLRGPDGDRGGDPDERARRAAIRPCRQCRCREKRGGDSFLLIGRSVGQPNALVGRAQITVPAILPTCRDERFYRGVPDVAGTVPAVHFSHSHGHFIHKCDRPSPRSWRRIRPWAVRSSSARRAVLVGSPSSMAMSPVSAAPSLRCLFTAGS